MIRETHYRREDNTTDSAKRRCKLKVTVEK